MRILSLNTHKGTSLFPRRAILNELREAIRSVQADLVFLQEVIGEQATPGQPQYEFLADQLWPEFAYGKNAEYPSGHHGNAILSKYPIVLSENIEISASRFEQRGLLYAKIAIPDRDLHVHCGCVHLGLFGRWRARQLVQIADYLRARVPADAPLIVAGDFNDWNTATDALFNPFGLTEVFSTLTGQHARTYPSWSPVLKLDRIYTRGFEVLETARLQRGIWKRLSDHVGISAELNL